MYQISDEDLIRIGKFLQQYVVLIRIVDESTGSPKDHGSGVLVKLEDKKYIFTAGHVLDFFKKKKRNVANKIAFEAARTKIEMSVDNYDIWFSASEDYGYILLSEKEASDIEAYQRGLFNDQNIEIFYDLNSPEGLEDYPESLVEDSTFLVVGFPGVIQRNLLSQTNGICTFEAGLIQKGENSDHPFFITTARDNYRQIDGDVCIRLIEDPERTGAILLGGTSGGGIFRIWRDSLDKEPLYLLTGLVSTNTIPSFIDDKDGIKGYAVSNIIDKLRS